MTHPSEGPTQPNPNEKQTLAADNGQSSPGSEKGLLAQPWVAFVLPLATFMLVGSIEPTPDRPFELLGWQIPYSSYPVVYAVKLALTMAVMAQVGWRGYRQFPLRVTPWAPAAGVIGVVLWIALAKLELEERLLGPLGLGGFIAQGQRAAFNPLEAWPDHAALAWLFLALRFWGLVVIVPIIEEFFLRGFLMRFVIAPDWWRVPFGTLTPLACVAGTLVPVLMHPGEMLAAAVWFSLITGLMALTRNIWDCVAAHATTNLLLGVYVVATGEWHFL
jgi:CAAX prenyl protease-like protein